MAQKYVFSKSNQKKQCLIMILLLRKISLHKI